MSDKKILRKPDWIRVHLPSKGRSDEMKKLLRSHRHCTVCEEAACPNLGECFNRGTATFLIMGDACTRNCTFCNVRHGTPRSLDPDEPNHLAETIAALKLNYIVITSVTRDDLPDGGASHYTACLTAIRAKIPSIKIEILVPDFLHCRESALAILTENPSDVFNHNIETAPRLYSLIRPRADYKNSLLLLEEHKKRQPLTPTKSGMMAGLGETDEEIESVMADLRAHGVDMLTLGQYLQPSLQHVPVDRYVHPDTFNQWAVLARKMGFKQAACGPFVRSSYHAEQQASDSAREL